jgi:hypothetical protein
MNMKYQAALKWILPLIGILALFAAGMGLFYQTPGQPYEYTNHRGETVMINGHGLYTYDSFSSAAQMQGNDLVTLVVGLPLLGLSGLFAFRGSLRGRLLLTGTLGFFLYTYMSMSMLTSFNVLFLVYVTLFSMSLIAFILCMMSFDLIELPRHFSPRLPRIWISGLMFLVAAFLSLAWIARVVSPFLQDRIPALENTTTLVIQAMDLGLITPLAVLAGILLLKRNPRGYLLASVTLLKGATLGLGVSVMVINMARLGVPDSLAIAIPFLVITLLNLVMTLVLLKHVDGRRELPQHTQRLPVKV